MQISLSKQSPEAKSVTESVKKKKENQENGS